MSYREQQYVVVLPDGTYVGKSTREVLHIDPSDTKNVRRFGGARARRWVKRHPDVNGIVVPIEGATVTPNEVQLDYINGA